jgi:hypothetical protein
MNSPSANMKKQEEAKSGGIARSQRRRRVVSVEEGRLYHFFLFPLCGEAALNKSAPADLLVVLSHYLPAINST